MEKYKKYNRHSFNPRQFNIIGFDTEDNGEGAPGNFLCACFYSEKEQKRFVDRNKARDYMLNQTEKTIFVAHNLAYDLDNLDYPEGNVERFYNGGRLIRGIYENPETKIKTTFIDTGNFFVGASLKQLGSLLGVSKLDYDIGNLKGKKISDFDMEQLNLMLTYCLRDSEVTYRITKQIQDICKTHGIKFKSSTTSGLARDIYFTSHCVKKLEPRDRFINDCERLAYYGGRTEVFNYNKFDTVQYLDINSSYPTAMLEQIFPYPNDYDIVRFPDKNIINKECIALCEIEIPKMFACPLPYRTSDGKLIFPYGTIKGAYTAPELRMAIKYGCKINHIYQAIVYNTTYRPFTQFVENFYLLKQSNTGIKRQFYKLIMNGLSGKFGEKRYVSYKGNLNNIKICDCDCEYVKDEINGDEVRIPGLTNFICDECHKIVIENRLFLMVNDDGWVSLQGGRGEEPKNAFPVFIAYITSYGRIKLYEEQLSKCNPIYCDTDSVVSVEPALVAIGEKLGEWEGEKLNEFKAISPKFYKTEKFTKLKGVPKKAVRITDEEYAKLADIKLEKVPIGDKFKYDKPLRLSEAVRRNLPPNKWTQIPKCINFEDTKRVKLDGGLSEPIYVNDTRDITVFDDLVKKE